MPEFLRIHRLDELPENLRGGVVAIGNFDGVHRGHQSVLSVALDTARKKGMPSLVLTFEPHPRSFFQPDVKLPRITTAELKADVIRTLGFDGVVEVPFTEEFSQLSADAFVDTILVSQLSAQCVVTGFDFHFGKGRQGGPAFLMDAGLQRGFSVELVDAFRDKKTEVVSSSRIREALSGGKLDVANELLGYRFRVRSTVIEGKQLGRTLGYPTANMALPPQTPLSHGIYAVRFQREDGSIHNGVASFGRRPTVTEDGNPLLETFVFDFRDDLYDEVCTVALVKYLRDEEKFDGLEPLVAQMKIDEKNARVALAGLEPLSALDRMLDDTA